MEAIYADWLSILPPVIAIILALCTKDVIISLLVGTLSGTLIYTVSTGGNPIMDTIRYTFTLMSNKFDVTTILVLALMGAFVGVISLSGSQNAIMKWASGKFRSKTSSQLAAIIVSFCVFLSDTFHTISVGAIAKPITDSNRVSRPKLAYIVDATAAPLCCIVPMGTWIAGICAVFPETNLFSNGMEIFFANIPFNLYCILSLVMVFYFAFPGRDFGKMRELELKAEETGDLSMISEGIKPIGNGAIIDLLIPLLSMVAGTVVFMLYTGGLFSGATISDAFANSSTSLSLLCGAFIALLVAYIMYIPRKIVSSKEFMKGVYEGMNGMLPGIVIIVLAWTLSGVCRNLLSTGEFVANSIVNSNFHIGFLPAIIFLVAAGLSFATGTSWGTFGILIPIVFNIFEITDPALLLPAIGATLGGACWGDHCSPISDTTILSSAGAGCDHLLHVTTQLPYALLGGACAIVGYLVAGFTSANVLMTWVGVFASLVVALFIIRKRTNSASSAPAQKA